MTLKPSKTGAPFAPVVALKEVHVSFGPVHALVGANLKIYPGECLGLVGHNGAGKSTLVNALNGRLTPTKGEVAYLNHESGTTERNTVLAQNAGIRSVFQELSLCPNLTVLENLRIPYRAMPIKKWRAVAQGMIQASLDEVFPNHGISPRTLVGDLSIAERQMVEIAIAFATRDAAPNLVILDEPTSSLDAAIAQQLLRHINKFCANGGAIVFITHMLGEIFEVSSRIVVMKDGKITENLAASEFTRDSLIDAMGHVVKGGGASPAAQEKRVLGTEVLRLKNGLNAKKGEIVGLAGLAGHGQAEALARFYMSKTSTWQARKRPEVAFVAGDRARDGVMPLWSIMKNMSLSTLKEFSQHGFVDRQKEQDLSVTWKDKIKIKSNSLLDPLLSLSGGNQQKVLFAKALASTAPIVVMDDPMRGVDVGTKKEVYAMIQAEAEAGRTFLWYSTETDEVLECDRVFVFRDGKISAELTGEAITEENLLRASFEFQEAAE
jgi:ribose transport system ATP-binding protein